MDRDYYWDKFSPNNPGGCYTIYNKSSALYLTDKTLNELDMLKEERPDYSGLGDVNFNLRARASFKKRQVTYVTGERSSYSLSNMASAVKYNLA